MNRERELVRLVSTCPWLMQALRDGRSMNLRSWCIGAGAVRNLVWDALSGHSKPSPLNDIDVAYFDPTDLRQERERELQSALAELDPSMPWEVTNQARVHLWFEAYFGHSVAPLQSLEEAVATWPEYATCVGISLDAADRVHVIAPWGLEDLFDMVVRHNPTRASIANFNERTASKRYAERWPGVVIIE